MTGRKHILLADDEAAFRFSAGLALRIAGYRVSEAQDGLDALDGLVRFKDEGTPVDLPVTDLRMPNLDGAELVDALKRHDLPVPVFVVSGCFDPESVRELSLFGCMEYMVFDRSGNPLSGPPKRALPQFGVEDREDEIVVHT